MKTIEINLFSFNELTKEAKEKAINDFRNNTEIYLDFFNIDCIETLIDKGFTGAKNLQYSLNYSQGDGLSFECYNFDNDFLLNLLQKYTTEKRAKIILNYLDIYIKGNTGSYCYASKNDISINIIDNYKELENINKLVNCLIEELSEIYLDNCNELETQGYNEIEYQLSDEYITETILMNDYEFTEDGQMY
jgi:hypothetical protein